MIVVKVMVCFLAIFGSEDCRLAVGGLPVVQGPPDSGQRVEGTSAVGIGGGGGGGGGGGSNRTIANEPPSATSAEPAALDPAKYRSEEKPNGDANRGESTVDVSTGVGKSLEDMKFESKKTTGVAKPASHGRRYSSVYRSADKIDEREASKEKIEFKNELTAHLAEALRDAVKRRETGPIALESIVEDDDKSSGENRQRKSIENRALFAAHQQTTNMRPIRKQHVVQGKRNVKGEAILSGKNRRNFNAANTISTNAAMAYGARGSGTAAQSLELDLSRALYEFGPAQLHALRGVFDKPSPPPTAKRNFRPIPAERVAIVPPRIIYDTKLIPAPFTAFGSEQKTVDALSALLGRTPAQQLEGLNLILGENERRQPSLGSRPDGGISRQGSTSLGQNFVTPIPSVDINDGLADGSFGPSINNGDDDGGVIDHGEILDAGFENSFDREETRHENPSADNHHRQESSEDVVHLPPGNGYKTIIPVVETPGETVPGRPPAILDQEERRHVWETAATEKPTFENSDRYPNHKEAGGDSNQGEGYAAKYNFGYHVNDYESGNNFGHEEERDGSITNGRYYVLLPDGRVQDVKYHVDEGGYHAKVSYQFDRSR